MQQRLLIPVILPLYYVKYRTEFYIDLPRSVCKVCNIAYSIRVLPSNNNKLKGFVCFRNTKYTGLQNTHATELFLEIIETFRDINLLILLQLCCF